MSLSWRITEIHELLSSHGEYKYLFSGKQVILVGDFLQLRPVANFFDLGRFVFDSPLFIKSISHRYELKMLLRQNENEKEFVANSEREFKLLPVSVKTHDPSLAGKQLKGH